MSIIHTTSHALADTASLITRFKALKPAVAKAITKASDRINARAGLRAAVSAEYDLRIEELRSKSTYVSSFEIDLVAKAAFNTSAAARSERRNYSNIKLSDTVLERFEKQLNSVSIDAAYAIDKIDNELERVGNWLYPALTEADHSALRAFRADLSALRSDISALKAEAYEARKITWGRFIPGA